MTQKRCQPPVIAKNDGPSSVIGALTVARSHQDVRTDHRRTATVGTSWHRKTCQREAGSSHQLAPMISAVPVIALAMGSADDPIRSLGSVGASAAQLLKAAANGIETAQAESRIA